MLSRRAACSLLLLLPCLARTGFALADGADPAYRSDPADPADGIVGDWLVESQDAVIRVRRHGDLFDGTIVWQLHDTFSAHDGPELAGKPATDIHNPDPALRTRPMDGLRLVWDLHYDSDEQEWSGGHVYDADDGHTFRCSAKLVDPQHLKIRGYFGFSLLGGSSLWTRVKKTPS